MWWVCDQPICVKNVSHHWKREMSDRVLQNPLKSFKIGTLVQLCIVSIFALYP